MYISKLTIKGFRSFGPKEVVIPVNEKLTAFIGLNSAGKTAIMDALRKMFGSSISERELCRQDFHIGQDEDINKTITKTLSVEVRFDFTDEEKETIPHFFAHMVVDDEDGDPYIRLRMEAVWNKSAMIQDGEIDSKLYFVRVAEGEPETEENKQIYPHHLRSLIQIMYVPAIRKPSDQIKYASGSILYRVLRKITWDDEFKEKFEEHVAEVTELFKNLPEVKSIQTSIKDYWKKFHKDERYKETDLTFGGSDFESVLKKLEVSFSPTGTHRPFSVDDLGEGYRSLFYLTLVCALLDVEEQLSIESEEIGITSPLLTILAIEEPENHIAPQLLGRVVNILRTISRKDSSQVFLSSHSPAIVKRVKAESICHFRITDQYQTEVNTILLPEKTDEAYKYVKEAIHNYPEIYFAKLVVIGEGDSEEVIFNHMMEVMNVDFDDNIITFAPLGHRFVNHIWKLLNLLHIPHITLLDLDIERSGGGWGRIKYVLQQLIENGSNKSKLLKLKDGSILSDRDLQKMHTWDLKSKEEVSNLNSWVTYLAKFDIFYSAPLDLDFLMLTHYPSFYKKAIPTGGGPNIPDKEESTGKYDSKISSAVQATLKSEEAIAETYSEGEKELMVWYNYHFLGRGKPSTHIQVLSGMTNRNIKSNLPAVFTSIFERITLKLKIEDESL